MVAILIQHNKVTKVLERALGTRVVQAQVRGSGLGEVDIEYSVHVTLHVRSQLRLSPFL